MCSIRIEGNKVYFIYLNTQAAALALARLASLNPKVCSRGGQFNALVVDLEKMPTQGEMQ